MSIKLKSLLVAAIAVISIVGLGTAKASATAYPPHGTLIYLDKGNCQVAFVHGNAFGGAYAKIQQTSGANTCGSVTYVRVSAWSQATGGVTGPYCGFGGSDSGCVNSGGWFQSFIPYNNILGSHVEVCNVAQQCNVYNYSGI